MRSEYVTVNYSITIIKMVTYFFNYLLIHTQSGSAGKLGGPL